MWVHLDPAQVQHHFAFIRVEIPDSIRIQEVEVRSLPPNWKRNPPCPSTRRIGAAWLEKRHTPLLRVPSVIVPHATNLVLNPEHPDARRLVIASPERFKLDLRMLK
ncbi:MAG: hypothetical protein FD180_1561 [Planctomycetota bacterium]|nr:MAG: hypothetical protein FD180_1561 [Planctomycetota bacterium]